MQIWSGLAGLSSTKTIDLSLQTSPPYISFSFRRRKITKSLRSRANSCFSWRASLLCCIQLCKTKTKTDSITLSRSCTTRPQPSHRQVLRPRSIHQSMTSSETTLQISVPTQRTSPTQSALLCSRKAVCPLLKHGTCRLWKSRKFSRY